MYTRSYERVNKCNKKSPEAANNSWDSKILYHSNHRVYYPRFCRKCTQFEYSTSKRDKVENTAINANAEVRRLTPPVLIPVLIQRTLCVYSQAVSIVVKASEYTGALPVTTRLLIEI